MKNKHIALCALMGSLCAPAFTEQDPDISIPTDPVQASSLPPEEWAAFKAPLEATVLPQAVTESIAPVSVVGFHDNFGMNMINRRPGSHSGFEPIAWRPLLRPAENSENTLILDARQGNRYHEGLFDGARVRVYHPVDGKLTLVRDAHVPAGGHRASGWIPLPNGVVQAKPQDTSFPVVFDKNARIHAPYWFMVKAVYRNMEESPESQPVAVTPAESSDQKPPKPYIEGRKWKNAKTAPGDARPVAPKNLRAEYADGVATLSWKGVPKEGLIGYRIYYASMDPKQFKGYGIDLDTKAPRPDQMIQRDDIVFIDQYQYRVSKEDEVDYWRWNAEDAWPNCGLRGFSFWPDEDPKKTWELVKHPEPIPPEFTFPGRTCLRLKNETDEPIGVNLQSLAGSDSAWYTTLQAMPHEVEFWLRGSGKVKIHFSGSYAVEGDRFPYRVWIGKEKLPIPPLEFQAESAWKKVGGAFTPPGVPASGLGHIFLTLDGPGEVYIDNVLIWEANAPPGDFFPSLLDDLREAKIHYMRGCDIAESRHGWSLDGTTNPLGGSEYSGHEFKEATMAWYLRQAKQGGFLPWLQPEICMDEQEWIDLVEYLAAPYDPKKDTPKSKPWAYKRWLSGQKSPWTEEFETIAFEFSNELWNGIYSPYVFNRGEMKDSVTGRVYDHNEANGMFQEYMYSRMRKSPYWSNQLEQQFRLFLGGWGGFRNALDFGGKSKRHSPSADMITYATYISNSGLGNPEILNDFKRFYLLQSGLSAVEPINKMIAAYHRELARDGHPARYGMYEFGPGYHVNMPGRGRVTPEVAETDRRLQRSMIAGVYIFDHIVRRARAGFSEAAFTSFGQNTGSWGTHTLNMYGAHGYPVWKGIHLFNNYVAGAFFDIDIESMPTWDFPDYEAEDNYKIVKREGMENGPLVTVASTMDGDRCTVVLLNRKLDNFPVAGDAGFVPATVRLPFAKARKLTLYKVVSDPRIDDRFEEHAKIRSVELDPRRFDGALSVRADTGADDRGLPPCSMFVYVFEGVDMKRVNCQPDVFIDAPKFTSVTEPLPLRWKGGDPDDDKLKEQWAVGNVADLTGSGLSVNLPNPGIYEILLKVDDGRGGTASDQAEVCAVLPWAGHDWTVPYLPNEKQIDMRITDSRMAITSTSNRKFNPDLAAMTQSLYGDFDVEVTLHSIEAEDDRANPAAALMLSREASWKGWYYRVDSASVSVWKDGAVSMDHRTKDVRLKQASFPVDLKIERRDSSATVYAKIDGAWKKLGSKSGVTGALYPALAVNPGAVPQKCTAEFTNLKIVPK